MRTLRGLATIFLALLSLPLSVAHAEEPAADAVEGSVDGGIGKGVQLVTPDGDLRFQIQARTQVRADIELPEGEAATISPMVRRMRLVVRAEAPRLNVGLYVQLGFAPGDLDPAAPNIVRDAVITWTPSPAFRLRVGQTKVPFNRERSVSSSALSFVDRSIVNGELTLDRDMGLQFLFDQLDGAGHLGLQLGVFGGDGRNVPNTDNGLLYTMRLEYKLNPKDDTYSEVDLRDDRSRPLFAMALGAGYNHKARRSRSTIGSFLPGDLHANLLHGEFDLIFKYEGWSIQAEVLARRSTEETGNYVDADGNDAVSGFRNGFGWFVAVGHAFDAKYFVGLRYAELRPLGDASTLKTQHVLRATGGWFIARHALKAQIDYGYLFGEGFGGGRHEVRLQTQVFF